MYDLPYFKEDNKQVLLQFMEEHPFALLTGSFGDGRQVATQVPLLTEFQNDQLVLCGHIMRHTDHHKAFLENPQVLGVFTGPSAYVSASWYSNPHNGSTWNYMSVHLNGKIQFLGDEGLIALLQKLTLRFENNQTSSPAYYNNLPVSFLQKMLPAIVAFVIVVDKMEHVFKLSQNRDESSYANIIQQLENRGGESAMVAEEMKKRKTALFPPGVEWDGKKFLS
jgi:transcriptional regulator